jgi:hypothetical protein
VAWGDGGQVGGAVMVCYNGAEDRSIFAGIGGLNVIGGNSPQGDGVWHHVVAVISDAQVSLYIDGRLAKSERAANGVNVRSNEDVTIGQGWGSCFLNGAVDEVMIFEKALTSDEVKVLYSRR